MFFATNPQITKLYMDKNNLEGIIEILFMGLITKKPHEKFIVVGAKDNNNKRMLT